MIVKLIGGPCDGEFTELTDSITSINMLDGDYYSVPYRGGRINYNGMYTSFYYAPNPS